MRTVGVLMNTFEGIDSQYSGGHVHTLEVLARLRNFRVIVFAPAYAAPIVRRAVPGASFVAMPSLPRDTEKSAFLFLHRALTSLRRVRELRACDYVYATSPALPDIVPAAFAKPGRATVCIFHVLPVPWRRGGSLVRNAIAFAAEAIGLVIVALACRSVIVGTRHTGAALRRRGIRQRLFVTTNGVAFPTDVIARTREPRAIYVGRLHPTKGIEDLIDAWASVVHDVPDASLTIVGDGPATYRRALEHRVARLGLASVEFVGRVDDARRLELLQRSAVFAFPSYEEGWGIAIAEAMAAGVPGVAYALPVYAEVFPRGLITVPIADVATFARRLVDVLTDGTLADRLSSDASTLAKTFSWDRAATVEGEALDATTTA